MGDKESNEDITSRATLNGLREAGRCIEPNEDITDIVTPKGARDAGLVP